MLLIECFEKWPFELESCPEKLKGLSESIRKLNLLEPVDLGKESQFGQFDDLIDKYHKKHNRKPVLKKQVTKEEEQLKKDLSIQISTLQQLKGIFLQFIGSAEINEKSKSDFLVMLSEMKDLYNRIIGNKMYTNKDNAIDEVSLVLDVCNRYKGQFQTLQEYVKRGGEWETALSKGIEEGLGRTSFGKQRQSANKDAEAKPSKLQTSELVKFHTNSGVDKSRKSRNDGAKQYNNPFDNSSFEEPKPSAKKEKTPEAPKKNLNQSSSFKHLERDDSAQTMEDMRNFILKEKGELENEIVSLKMKLDKKDQEFLEMRVQNEQQATRIKSLTNENKDLQRQVKELKEEIYSRILNITMTSNKTGSHSMNKFDSSHKINYKSKYKPRDRDVPRRSTSFLSKPEDRIEKTKQNHERFETLNRPSKASEALKLDKKALSNSKAFLQDFNKEINNILNRTSKAKNEDAGPRKRYGSQKRLHVATDSSKKYMDLMENKLGTYTATKTNLGGMLSGELDLPKKTWDVSSGLRDFSGSLMKTKSQKYLQNEPGSQEYGDVTSGLQFPQRNRMAYTLNLGDPASFGGAPPRPAEFDKFNVRANRLNNRPHSMANHEAIFNHRQMDLGMMNNEDPRFQMQFEDMGNFRTSMYPPEGGYNMGVERGPAPGMGGQVERGGPFDAAKKLERYKNQMKMKQGDSGYGGRFY